MSLSAYPQHNRRHFLKHLTTGAATLPSLAFMQHLQANADRVRKKEKACILIWLNGGAPTIDMWDLKPDAPNSVRGEFKPISTSGDMQICEHLPKTAQAMKHLSIVRSMSTDEADHSRGRYFLHTAYRPNPTVVHPTFGSVVGKELGTQRSELEIPAFISVGGGSGTAGFLGKKYAPFVVDSSGRIRNMPTSQLAANRQTQRMKLWDVIETGFINSNRGDAPQAHRDVYEQTHYLMGSQQAQAFRVTEEPAELRTKYGQNQFGDGLLMARRLVEAGVPFVEVTMGGWDLHQNVFNTLRDQRLPMLDAGLSALTEDLKQRGMLEHTAIVCMGEFGRTPQINVNNGRDHWATSWSILAGGGGLQGGRVIGGTTTDGKSVLDAPYKPGNLWSTIASTLGIPLDTKYTTKNGRPMKIAAGLEPIKELIG